MSLKLRGASRDGEQREVSKRGRKPTPVVENPMPNTEEWIDPPGFREALVLHLGRFSESYYQLHRAIIKVGEKLDRSTLQSWVEGRRAPRNAASLEILARIEHRYGLPAGYFKSKLPNPARAPSGFLIKGVSPAEQRRLAWHLPDDFNSRSLKEQAEILDWVQNVVISGATEYPGPWGAAQGYVVRHACLPACVGLVCPVARTSARLLHAVGVRHAAQRHGLGPC